MDKIQQNERFLADARAGKQPNGLFTGFASADLLEVSLSLPFDWVIVDQEHTAISHPSQVMDLLRVAELKDIPLFVKLASWNPIAARDALDAGANGIQVPFVESADMLREILSACRFRPAGTRGFCAVSRSLKHDSTAEGIAQAIRLQNEKVLVIPMIETEAAVENLDEMLAGFPECPIFAIGPDDLRMSMGLSFDEADTHHFVKILRALSKKIRAAGKLNMLPVWGPMPGMSNDDLAESIEGFHNDLPYYGDGVCLLYGLATAMEIRDKARKKVSPR